jgi:hypothetical protein
MKEKLCGAERHEHQACGSYFEATTALRIARRYGPPVTTLASVPSAWTRAKWFTATPL